MSKSRRFLVAVLAVAMLGLAGCKAQQQMQQQVADINNKADDAQRKISVLDHDVKRANADIAQLKQMVTKLGNVIVDLQKAEEERQQAAAAAKARAASKGGAKKPAAKKKR